jgi:hypothetical protein
MRALLAIAALFSSTAFAAITNCATNSLFKIDNLGFWPDPAVSNSNSTVSFAYTVPGPDPITAGTAKYSIKYNFIPLTPTVEDLCKQTTCPILPGTYNQSASSDFPNVSGSITIKIEWFDAANKPLLCAQISTKVAPPE